MACVSLALAHLTAPSLSSPQIPRGVLLSASFALASVEGHRFARTWTGRGRRKGALPVPVASSSRRGRGCVRLVLVGGAWLSGPAAAAAVPLSIHPLSLSHPLSSSLLLVPWLLGSLLPLCCAGGAGEVLLLLRTRGQRTPRGRTTRNKHPLLSPSFLSPSLSLSLPLSCASLPSLPPCRCSVASRCLAPHADPGCGRLGLGLPFTDALLRERGHPRENQPHRGSSGGRGRRTDHTVSLR